MREYFPVQQGVLVFYQRMAPDADLVKQAVCIGNRCFVRRLACMKTGNPDFEKLVQIAAPDTQITQTFKERKAFIFRLCDNPAVEFKEGKLTVQIKIRFQGTGWQILDRFCHHGYTFGHSKS